ncbi:MAG: hypothetical protein VB089_10780, partial [Anaerolineaceae bacterium]|nr:hypothetical protein [Anaerolineaceae bacterium]
MQDSTWDLLAILAIIGVIGVGSVMLLIFINPYSAINPFPPPEMPPTMMVPTSTPTLRSLPATWTATIGGVNALTFEPSATELYTPTGFLVWTYTPTPSITPT